MDASEVVRRRASSFDRDQNPKERPKGMWDCVHCFEASEPVLKMIVDRAAAGWSGRVGVITDLLGAVELDPAETIAMACGPEVMMRFSYHELLRRGVASERVYMSMERDMKCAVGFCGHCQFSPVFVCKDGPVFRADRVELLGIREL